MITERCDECRENVPLLVQNTPEKQVYVLATHYKMDGRCKGSGKPSKKVNGAPVTSSATGAGPA